VVNNIIGTTLYIKRKTKDNLKARLDLEETHLTHLRGNLHPDRTNPNKTFLPPACFTMSTKEKYYFLTILMNARLPHGYASNVSHCVKLKECCSRDMKSHDNHIFIQ
jgi:hypothetical protein